MSHVYLSLHHFRIGYLPLSVWHTTVWHTVSVPVTCRCLSGEQGKSAARGRGRPLRRWPVNRLVFYLFLDVSCLPVFTTCCYCLLAAVCIATTESLQLGNEVGCLGGGRWTDCFFFLVVDFSCLPVTLRCLFGCVRMAVETHSFTHLRTQSGCEFTGYRLCRRPV